MVVIRRTSCVRQPSRDDCRHVPLGILGVASRSALATPFLHTGCGMRCEGHGSASAPISDTDTDTCGSIWLLSGNDSVDGQGTHGHKYDL